MIDSRQQATERLIDEPRSRQASAVAPPRFDASEFGGGRSEPCA